jgi:hypothetical protein
LTLTSPRLRYIVRLFGLTGSWSIPARVAEW